jgi:hypothetical protein
VKRSLLLVVIILITVLSISLTVPGCKTLGLGKTEPPQNTAPPPPPPPPRPDIKVTAVLTQQTVSFSEIVTMIIVVSNYGQGTAYNTTVYGRANPSGYLEILACQPPAAPMAPAGFKFALGDIYPGNRIDIRLVFRTPSQRQIGNLPGFNIGVNFGYDYVYQNQRQPEANAGELTFSMSGTGGILFYKAY